MKRAQRSDTLKLLTRQKIEPDNKCTTFWLQKNMSICQWVDKVNLANMQMIYYVSLFTCFFSKGLHFTCVASPTVSTFLLFSCSTKRRVNCSSGAWDPEVFHHRFHVSQVGLTKSASSPSGVVLSDSLAHIHEGIPIQKHAQSIIVFWPFNADTKFWKDQIG